MLFKYISKTIYLGFNRLAIFFSHKNINYFLKCIVLITIPLEADNTYYTYYTVKVRFPCSIKQWNSTVTSDADLYQNQ